jgi:hypothetical protein
MARLVYVDATDAERLAEHLMDAPRVIREKFKERAIDAARLGADAVRAKVLGMPVHGTKHTGLRVKLAGNVYIDEKRWGASIRVGAIGITGKRSRALPGAIDDAGEAGFFSHPIYGRGRTSQRGYDFFRKTLDHMKPIMNAEVDKILDDVAEWATHRDT